MTKIMKVIGIDILKIAHIGAVLANLKIHTEENYLISQNPCATANFLVVSSLNLSTLPSYDITHSSQGGNMD